VLETIYLKFRKTIAVRGTHPAQSLGKFFVVVPLTFLVLQVQLIVLVSAFVMVTTVWSVACLLFYTHGAPVH